MIKRFLYGIIAFTIVAFTFTSCEDTNRDNFRVDTDKGYVQFADNEQINFVGGFHTLLEIPIDLHTNTNFTGLDVYYKIEKIPGSADINSVIVHDPGFVHFEPGQISSTTKIEVKSDIPESGFMFGITLSSASRNNIDIIDNVETIYLTKNVCFRPIVMPIGNYVGEVYQIELDQDGSPKEPVYQSTITTSLVPTGEPNVYTFGNGAWGSDFFPSITGNPSHASINYAGTITINADGTVVVNGNDLVSIGGEPTVYTTENNKGELNPCAIEISYVLGHGLAVTGLAPLVKVVIRPAN